MNDALAVRVRETSSDLDQDTQLPLERDMAARAEPGAEVLTPQELQVARTLAAGRTTREAAAALFLSPKTIEYHLRNVYTKLGVRTRADLATALVDRS